VLAELSYFHRQLCAKKLKNMMEKLEKEISVLIYKLEEKNSSMVVNSDATSSYSYSI
jgi:hypothetical protein